MSGLSAKHNRNTHILTQGDYSMASAAVAGNKENNLKQDKVSFFSFPGGGKIPAL